MSSRKLTVPFLAICALSTACVQVQPRADFERARTLARESTGVEAVFDPYEPGPTDEELATVLAGGLSRDEAVRLALRNNRGLQADFMEIGIAHADWVQSRLLSNPSLDVLWRFPADGGRSQLEALLSQELLELWRLSDRKAAAQGALDATVLRIARRAGELCAETKTLYHRAVAARDLHGVAKENLALVERTFAAVEALHAAGSADVFDLNLARGGLLSTQLAVQSARLEASTAARRLLGILSVDAGADALVLVDPLPEAAAFELEPEELIELARRSRLDLRALSAALESARARMRVEEGSVWNSLTIGPSVERPAGGDSTLTGPGVSLSVPLFDRNQAQIARVEFQLEEVRKLHEAADLAVAMDVRTAADVARTAAEVLAFYRRELLPQAEASFAYARESHAAGRSSLLALLEVQRALLEARRQSIELRREAASAATDLERVVGAPLGAGSTEE